jgi:hypothetical protein
MGFAGEALQLQPRLALGARVVPRGGLGWKRLAANLTYVHRSQLFKGPETDREQLHQHFVRRMLMSTYLNAT